MKRKITSTIAKFVRDEVGLELSEYVVSAFLITLAVIAAFMSVADSIREKIVTLASYLK